MNAYLPHLVQCWAMRSVCEKIAEKRQASLHLASKIKANSTRTSRFEFDSKVTCRFEIFESAAHAVCRHITNYARSLFDKNINLFAVCSWVYVYNSTLRVAVAAVAGAHTQLPHDNRHWTCKRLPPYSVRYSIRIRIVAAFSIRDSIRTEISDSQIPSYNCLPEQQ